jgi:hypothetical protein
MNLNVRWKVLVARGAGRKLLAVVGRIDHSVGGRTDDKTQPFGARRQLPTLPGGGAPKQVIGPPEQDRREPPRYVISRELPTRDAGAPDRCVSFKALRRRFSLEYHGGMAKKLSKLEVVCDGDEIFVVLDGVRIARRGYPGTPEAGTWVSLVPGWIVRDDFGAPRRRGALGQLPPSRPKQVKSGHRPSLPCGGRTVACRLPPALGRPAGLRPPSDSLGLGPAGVALPHGPRGGGVGGRTALLGSGPLPQP